MKVAVIIDKNGSSATAEMLARRIKTTVFNYDDHLPSNITHKLLVNSEYLLLLTAGGDQTAATRVDFLDPTLLYRLRTSGKRQGIGKAVGLDKASGISVLDATAGLGKDAAVLAYLGCYVEMLEKSPVIHALLEDGMKRALAADDETLGLAPQRMRLALCDARERFDEIQAGKRPKPDVVYLDPMFPPRTKSASVKKDIALLQSLLEVEADFRGLLAAARNSATYRVVVKRPGNKPENDVPAPTFIVPGKSAHFEVYVNSSFSSMRS